MTKDLIKKAVVQLNKARRNFRKYDPKNITGGYKELLAASSLFNLANVPKLSNQLSNLVRTAERNLGQNPNWTGEHFNELRSAIRKLVSEAEDLLKVEKIDINKNEPHLHLVKEFPCPYCHYPILTKSKFCSACGKQIIQRPCPHCHHVIHDGQNFCPACGTCLNPSIGKS